MIAYSRAGFLYKENPVRLFSFFDAAGRQTKVIRNYVDGNVSSSYPDEDVTVETTYNVDSAVATLVAKNPTTGDQTTKYVYGTTLADSAIARADLLRAVIYPDSDDAITPLGDGADGIYDRVEYKYNRQGQRTDAKDQNGSVHQYDFDKQGRPLHDRVTTLAAGVDGAVRRQSVSYDIRGLVEKQSTYDNAAVGSGSVVNQVQFAYNSFAQATTEYQEHGGAVNTSTSVKVQQALADGSAGHIRPTKTTYPNGRILRYEYNSGTDDAINRMSFLADDSSGSVGTHLAEYGYLGLGGIVQVDYTEPDIRYDLAFGAGDDPLDGLDRFDRVMDLVWRNYGNSTDAVRIKHGYDRTGIRLWREDPVAATNSKNFDELYSYDGIYQLKTLDRGDLNANHDALTGGTKNFAESWSLDMTGNWSGYKKDDDGNGTWELDQSRTHNAANEISQIAGASTHVAHDRAGNMTKTPKPSDWSAHYDLTYDAWNRLVKVMDGQTTVATYSYDARNFRVSKTASGTTRHYYYNEAWQCLEERLGSATVADRQFIWGLRYIDDLILRDRNADSNVNTGSLGLSGSGLEERLYCLQDPNWNVVAITNTTGTAQERFTYDAYGKSTTWTGTFGTRSSSSYDWEVLYCGYRFDAAVGLADVRFRVLHPVLGVWPTRDPLPWTGPSGLYLYALSSPVNLTDPSGLDGQSCQAVRFMDKQKAPSISMWVLDLEFSLELGFEGQRCTLCCSDGSIGYKLTGSLITKGKAKLGVMFPIVMGIYIKPFGEGEYGGSERLTFNSCTGQTKHEGCRWIRFAGGVEGCGGSAGKTAKVCLKAQCFYRSQTCGDSQGKRKDSVCSGCRVRIEACFFWRCYEYIALQYQWGDCTDAGGG